MTHRSRRRSSWAVALGCVVTVAVSGCAAPSDSEPEAVPATAAATSPPTEQGISAERMQLMADDLRQSVPCSNRDALLDDLAFWDAMRGYDCFGTDGPTFIRVYAHYPSVVQTLDEWRDTFDADRTYARGRHWYVIGPPSIVATVHGPGSDSAIVQSPPEPDALTPRQDYLTTCARFVASEGERYVRHPDRLSGSASQYETLFPGVTQSLHEAIDRLGIAHVRAIHDQDRWLAALTPLGPRMKARCGVAFDRVHNTVASVGGAP